jgi:hypothetical protein
MPCDQPVFVTLARELLESLAQFLDGVEDADPQQVLLECADEPLGAASCAKPRLARRRRRFTADSASTRRRLIPHHPGNNENVVPRRFSSAD